MALAIEVYDDSYWGHYFIQDLRVIKALKYPDKSFIKALWFNLKSSGFSEGQWRGRENLLISATQWLFTPNYSNSEKMEIIEQDSERFFSYFNSQGQPSLVNNGPVERDARSILMNSVLNSIFASTENFIEPESGAWNFNKLEANILAASPEQFNRFKWFIDHIKPSLEVRSILTFAASSREKLPYFNEDIFFKIKSQWEHEIAEREKSRDGAIEALPRAPEKARRSGDTTKELLRHLIYNRQYAIDALSRQLTQFEHLATYP